MSRSAGAWIALAAVGVVSAAAALLLGRDPAPEPLPLPAPVTTTDAAPAPRTTEPARPPAPRPTTTTPATTPATTGAQTASGPALVEQVRAIVRRGEGAQDAAAEQAAAHELTRVLADLAARGEAALPDARLLIAPDEPPGVQEVGARVLARLGSPPALEALTELARSQAPGPARLQALRALRASSLPFARGALLDVGLDPSADLEVRTYALDLMRDLVGAESTLHDVATDAQEPAPLRAMALDALLALEPARGRAVLAEVEGDEALRPYLEALRTR